MIDYAENGDITMHLPVMYTITRAIKPKVIVEIGIRGGNSTRAFDMAITDGGFKCDHHCCDINPGCARVVDRLESGGIFYGMDSKKFAEEWAKDAVLSRTDIDILFIDGSHKYEDVLDDFRNFFPFVRKNGFIFFHDTYPPESKKDDPGSCWSVYKILNDLSRERTDGRIEFITMPYQNGLTICRAV